MDRAADELLCVALLNTLLTLTSTVLVVRTGDFTPILGALPVRATIKAPIIPGNGYFSVFYLIV